MPLLQDSRASVKSLATGPTSLQKAGLMASAPEELWTSPNLHC